MSSLSFYYCLVLELFIKVPSLRLLQADEAGKSLPGAEPETGSIDVQGTYTFVGDDGRTYSVSYQANEAGFQPQADFLPVAPAQIPEYAQLRQEHPELFWAETQ